MPKPKITTIDKYKITGIGILLTTLLVCQFRWVRGKFYPIQMPNEWWAIFTGCVTYTFMAISGLGDKITASWMDHTKGLIWIVLVSYIGVSYYLGIPVSREVMATVGAIQGILYSTKETIL